MSGMHRHDCNVAVTQLKLVCSLFDNALLDRRVLSNLTDDQLTMLSSNVHEVVLLLNEFIAGNEDDPGY